MTIALTNAARSDSDFQSSEIRRHSSSVSSVVKPRLCRRELFSLLGFGALLIVWLFLPVIRQPQEYHHFADTRAWLGIPNAADVLSNLPFVLVGLCGLWRLQQNARSLPDVVRASLAVFFAGFFLTGFGSGYYHWAPSDPTLVWDRLPMTIAFSGALGALLAERVSQRAGIAGLIFMLIVGPASVFYWKVTGDLSLYGVAQFGTGAVLLVLLMATRKGDDPIPWWILLVFYVVAKVFEDADAVIWQFTGGLFAGHALKHLAAAAGGWAIVHALRAKPPAEKPT